MESITHKGYTIKYMTVSGNVHIFRFGRQVKTLTNLDKITGYSKAKLHIDNIIENGE